jgi:hypothetical protein
MEDKPTAAFIVSLIGGILVLLGGLVLALIGTVIAFITFGFGLILWIFVIFGVLIIIGALAMNSNPGSAKTWGIVILILGVISLFGGITAVGGLLAIIGGILALVWKPSAPATAPPPPP